MIKIFLPLFLSVIMLSSCVKVELASKNKDNVVSEFKLFIERDEFNSKFRKANEPQFENGKFELMDGTIVNADFHSYGLSPLFEYATAIFYEGELASLNLITSLGIKEIESGLGIKFAEIALVEPTESGYHIVFNSMFHDTNISLFPYQWNN